MTRDELLRKVEDALIASPGHAVIGTDGVAKMPVEAHAAAAADAVLTAIADGMVEESDRVAYPVAAHQVECVCRDCIVAGTLSDAADRIYSLIEEGKSND